MPVKWKNGAHPSMVVEKIQEIKEIGGDGKVRFKGFIHEEYRSILFAITEFPDDLPEIEKRRIISQGLFSAAGKGTLTKNTLISEFNQLLSLYYRKKQKRFALYTSLSVMNLNNEVREYFGRDQLIIDNKPHPKFQTESRKITDRAVRMMFAEIPKFYKRVRVHVTARTESEAADLALNHLDLIRGIWNLRLNFAQPMRLSFGGKTKPVNRIITGPIHTLHYPNGKIAAEDRWWYEPTFLEGIKRLDFDKHHDDLISFTKSVRDNLEESPYSEELKDALRRYCRALDERNLNNAFLRLWSVLELLTATGNQRYDVTIKRASYIFEEREYYRHLLDQLREYRNSTVHDDAQTQEIETYLYQLKNFVDELFRFHLFNNFGFETIEDAGTFLSLPIDSDALKKRRDMAIYALRYRSYESE